MRFVWAVIAFVLAAALIGAGIAQRTVFLGPDSASTRVEIEEEQPYILVDAEVFRAHTGTQTLEVSGAEQVFVAYGRTADMEAWLSDAPYNHVTLNDAGEAVTESVPAAEPTWEGPEYPGRSPAGSDLWLEEHSAENEFSKRLQLPEGVSVLIASDGHAPAPSEVSIVWPISNATPWVGPLIAAGALLLLLGVILYALGVRHVRRSRGPRRKGTVLPPTEPIAVGRRGRRGAVTAGRPAKEISTAEGPAADDAAADGAAADGAAADGAAAEQPNGSVGAGGAGDSGEPTSSPDDSSSGPRRGGRRTLLALPAMGLTVALLTGCSPDVWPQFTASPTPSPTETVVAPENQQAPAMTDAQAEKIVADVAETVAEADETRDADLAATRLEGIALQMREVNYRIRGEVDDYPAPLAIPGGRVRILLPQAFDEWPRTAMLVVEEDGAENAPPSIMTVSQADPWARYKVSSVASLEASAEIPKLAPWYFGAALVPPDSSFLSIPPSELGAAYADILAKGEKSEFATMFDLESDTFRAAVEEKRAATLAELNKTGEETASLEFQQGPGPGEPTALATLESGAIVAVTVDEVDLVRSTAEGALIKLEGDRPLVALTGEETVPGVKTTYTDQLFFSVPAQGSSEKIRLLGYSSGLRDAEILETEG